MFWLSYLNHTQDTKYCMWLPYYPQSSGMYHGGGHLSQSIYQYFLWIRKKHHDAIKSGQIQNFDDFSCLWEGSCLICVFCVCFRIMVSDTYYVVFLLFLRLVLPLFLDCPFLIAPLVFSNVYFIKWKKKIITIIGTVPK